MNDFSKTIKTKSGEVLTLRYRVNGVKEARLILDEGFGAGENYNAFLTLPELVQLATILQDLIEELKEEESDEEENI